MVKGLTQYCHIWQQNIHNTNLEYPIIIVVYACWLNVYLNRTIYMVITAAMHCSTIYVSLPILATFRLSNCCHKQLVTYLVRETVMEAKNEAASSEAHYV